MGTSIAADIHFNLSSCAWAYYNSKARRGVRLLCCVVLSLALTKFRLHVTFIDKEGDEHTFEVSAGDNLLDIAQEYDLEMEGKHTCAYAPSPRN